MAERTEHRSRSPQNRGSKDPRTASGQMAWWQGPSEVVFPSTTAAFHRWIRRLEASAGGSFVLPDGAQFGGKCYWWGKRNSRPAPHEGVDFCKFMVDGEATPRQLPVDFALPAVADGEVVGIFDDFLAKTIVLRHKETVENLHKLEHSKADAAAERWPVCTLLAHIQPKSGTALGQHVDGGSEGEIFQPNATCEPHVAILPASRTRAPSHIHLSMLAAPTTFPWALITGWPELLKRSADREVAFLAPPLPEGLRLEHCRPPCRS
eukprot:TRINITY_DN9086_c0_g1_i1.p1 TRINITY_DN9086_c0_g1~~TRINITY_DN9086_c0_g1_i1.p1  ORF type:complete len:264 (-),score=47.22 TRINITY_DN9086_c0_g1_i1:367-1158(-)